MLLLLVLLLVLVLVLVLVLLRLLRLRRDAPLGRGVRNAAWPTRQRGRGQKRGGHV